MPQEVDANHLFIIDGQFDATVTIAGQGTSFASGKEIFSVLVGPKLTNRQFVRAIATASIVKPQIGNIKTGGFAAWNILDADADWDDESGQVELRIEAQVDCMGANQNVTINGFAFHITILAALPANQNCVEATRPRERRVLKRRVLLVSEYF